MTESKVAKRISLRKTVKVDGSTFTLLTFFSCLHQTTTGGIDERLCSNQLESKPMRVLQLVVQRDSQRCPEGNLESVLIMQMI